MTATTQTQPEAHHASTPGYQLTVFFWQANIFLELCKQKSVQYQRSVDPAYPYYAIFHFSGDEEFIIPLMQRLIKTGAPFTLCNFDPRDPV